MGSEIGFASAIWSMTCVVGEAIYCLSGTREIWAPMY